jgi:L-seryl-tRNA(Ser) seleniumtransferase
MANGHAESIDTNALAEERLTVLANSFFAPKQSRVINATGVVVHTNLGRAPLSDAAKLAMVEAAGYSSVEMNLEDGKRGRRGGFAEDLICELTGAEAAVIVNNCAAAAFLVLSVLAKDKEVIVSRGELVEKSAPQTAQSCLIMLRRPARIPG